MPAATSLGSASPGSIHFQLANWQFGGVRCIKRLCILLGLLAACSVPAFAQTTHVDLYAGYSFMSYYGPDQSTLLMNGWNAGGAYNLKRWFAIAADLSGEYETQHSRDLTINGTRTHIYNYLFGPRVYVRGRNRNTAPFIEGGVGRSHINVFEPAVPPLPEQNVATGALAWKVGGGFDHRITNRFAVRGSADIVRTGFYSTAQTNFQVSVAFVYHFRRPRNK